MIQNTISRVPRHVWLFAVITLAGALFITRGIVERPNYTDAYYYFNAANRLSSGDGLTDLYLWNYIGVPDHLEAGETVPSHLYWMPLPSVLAGASMGLLNAPGDYAAAQLPFTLMFAGLVGMGFWLGGEIGGTRRHMWVAGLITLFSGFFIRFWGHIDTFAPYAFSGALMLTLSGCALRRTPQTGSSLTLWFVAGVMVGFGHLTRADGLLLLLMGWVGILWPWDKNISLAQRLRAFFIVFVGYSMVMLPWFYRNLDVLGTPLPVGGAESIWYTSYNELFNYPAGADLGTALSDHLDLLLDARWTALVNNLQHFIAVEGLVVMAPLMLIGLWNRRHQRFLQVFALYAVALHLAMTFVFAFPGYRGGLLHSSAALVPWWAALGVVGLDDTVEWIAKHRRTWRPKSAKIVFSVGLVILAVVLSWNLGSMNRTTAGTPRLFRELDAVLPEDARLLINDPAQFYYFTGRGGAVLPNASVTLVPELAERYQLTHVLVEGRADSLAVPEPFSFDVENPPDFLIPIEADLPGAWLYAIER